MSTMILDIQNYLEANGFKNVTSSMMPAQPDNAIAVFEYPGASALETFEGNIAEDCRAQLQFRGAPNDYLTPRNVAKDARNLLDKVVNKKLGESTVLYQRIHALGSPFPLKEDTNHRPYIAINFVVLKEPEV